MAHTMILPFTGRQLSVILAGVLFPIIAFSDVSLLYNLKRILSRDF